MQDEANPKDIELVKELLQSVTVTVTVIAIYFIYSLYHPSLSSLELISKPVISQLKRGRVMKVIMKPSSAASIKNAQENLEKCLRVLSVRR